MRLEQWRVTARNLAEHAVNPIHTDDGAQAAGFPRALVAGVTTYAYLTHPVVSAWGHDWLSGGSAHVRFRAPVFLDDVVLCSPSAEGVRVGSGDGADCADNHATVSALVDGEARVTVDARRVDGSPPEPPRSGEALRTRHVLLEGEFGDQYGLRAGDDLDFYTRLGVVHPAVWPALANHLVHTEVANGSWIHTSSAIRHHAVGRVGGTADISAVVVRRLESAAGVRAVLDVRIEIEGTLVATLEHHAIVDMTRRSLPR